VIGVTRKLKRVSSAAIHSAGRRRQIIIELAPPGDTVGFRLKGMRRTYRLPVGWCYTEAVKAELDRERAERRRARRKAG
jgi:hypothetical protein